MSKGFMDEDYNDNTYDLQYTDSRASGGVQLNHSTLYVTNIPTALTRDGLKAAFTKFGTVTKVFLSTDPRKRYAMITFETASEAKSAIMKLNQTEPLRLNVNIAHNSSKKDTSNDTRERRYNSQRDEGSSRNGSYGRPDRNQVEMVTGDDDEELYDVDIVPSFETQNLPLEMERLRLKHLKLQEAQVQCMQRMLLLNSKKAKNTSMNTNANRSILPDGRIVVRNNNENDESEYIGSGAGDSKRGESVCSCKAKAEWWEASSSTEDGTSTPSTCVLCSEDRSDTKTEGGQDKSELTIRTDIRKLHTNSDLKHKAKFTNTTSKSVVSKVTELSSKRSESKTDAGKTSDLSSKRLGVKRLVRRSEGTCEFKCSDLYSDSDDDLDETNRLIELRTTDYIDIVEDHLRVIVALAGYPKAKMKLQQMELFQKSLNDVMDMQLKAGLLKKMPTLLDYYLNRGAIVCICKDLETRDWLVRISPGLQERMSNNIILLKARVKRLCLAVSKIPHTCWPTTAQDVFKLLQYFNPTLRTNLWRIYAQKTVGDVECTSFLLDRISGELIRGPSFKNIIDYNQMEFELTGYSEIYYDCLLSDMDEDLRSVASRVKLLDELRSNGSTPRNNVPVENETLTIGTKKDEQEKDEIESLGVNTEGIVDPNYDKDVGNLSESRNPIEEIKKDLKHSIQKDILRKLKDVKYISDKDEVIVWSEDNNTYESEQDVNVQKKESESNNNNINFDLNENTETNDVVRRATFYVSDNNESIYESNETLMSRNSNVNIDSNRGMAYYRRTNYLHVENELKIAISLVGYPQNKLEGTHIRRLKQLFKEYLHKDMKSQRFANLIIPKFQDVYLSNGAVIYICDSLETRDYLTEVLPKFINATGLKLVFRSIRDLVRYTRIVMRLPEKIAHVESAEILRKLQMVYSNLKPDCWKFYSDVAGKQKRQFGVDPESLEVIRSPDFDATYEGEKICFRIIDRQKRDVSFEETMTKVTVETENVEERKLKDTLLKNMYCPIDTELLNTPLTRVRTNHYTNLIADDLKLYVGPSNYPESRIDEPLFHTIKITFETIVFNTVSGENLKSTPKIHDMYLFDGVIFIICKDMSSRKWIEDSLTTVNSMLQVNLKATEFRGAVGIISMAVKTDKDTDEVIEILQRQNPRLRTKYWRKISTVSDKSKLDVVLQIDKLSAQVINEKDFNKFIDNSPVQFSLGHLQSLLKPKASLEQMCKKRSKKLAKESKTKTDVASQADAGLMIDNKFNNNSVGGHDNEEMSIEDKKIIYYKDFDPKIINSDSPKSPEVTYDIENEQENYCKMILKIPQNILPENKDDLNIIFDLLEDKNPGLNTELWQVSTDVQHTKGKITVHIDRQSASVIKGNSFDPYLAGLYKPNCTTLQQPLTIPALQRVSKHLCVVCASPAEMYCARCELTPYCGQQCQRTDWMARHSSVCHNLMRSSKPSAKSEDFVDVEPNIQPAMPLRKPHPANVQGAKRDQAPVSQLKSGPAYHTEQKTPQHNNRGTRNNSYNNNNKQDKKPANNNKKNDAHNHNGNKSNHYPKASTSQPTNTEASKTQQPTTPAPDVMEPSIRMAEAMPKVKAPAVIQTEAANTTMPQQNLVPKTYLLETLSVGDTAMLSVDALAKDCGTKQPGFVCLSINQSSEGPFQQLCVQFGELCAAAERVHSVVPGEAFAYLDAVDDAWYRARCLSPASAALLDGCRVVALTKEDKYAALTGAYADTPEFCCVLQANGVALGNSLIATLVSKTAAGGTVSLTNAETGAAVGEGEVSRWLPDVEYPKPKPTGAQSIPEVIRPHVTNNSRVLLVEAGAADRVLVRPADADSVRRFDALLEDVVMYGINAKPLSEPPAKGETVIGLYTDGLHYRALCRRTSVKQNKYLLEYIEFGNSEVTQLEKLFACPPELTLSSQPTQVALVKLQTDVTSLTEPATQYLEKIREDNLELVLTIPSGASTAPSGTEVCLTVAKNNQSVNRTVTEMCTPEWKKLEERGGDVIESEVIMNEHLQYLELPEGGCELDVLDMSALACGTVSACELGVKHAQFVLGPLTDRMAEYCDSQIGKEPYLPTLMEVCIAKCPPYPQWFRAVLVDHRPGELEAKVCYVDYGNIESVPVSGLRKMLPEFVRDVPALALHVEIKDFPEEVTPQQLGRAIQHMRVTDEGRGTLRVVRCERRVHGVYAVDAPALLAAMRG